MISMVYNLDQHAEKQQAVASDAVNGREPPVQELRVGVAEPNACATAAAAAVSRTV